MEIAVSRSHCLCKRKRVREQMRKREREQMRKRERERGSNYKLYLFLKLRNGISTLDSLSLSI
jgi:hypothetical protein